MSVDMNDIFANVEAMRDPQKMLEEMSVFLKKLKQAGEEKVPLAEVMDVSKDQIEQMYAMGFMAYQAKRYLDAQMVFMNLFLLNPQDDRFSFGVASCLKVRGEYKQALLMYAMALNQNTESSKLPFYAAQSAWLEGDKELTVQLLQEAIKRNNAKEGVFVKSAKEMLENIETGAEPPKPKKKVEGTENDASAPQQPDVLPGGGRRRMRV